MHCLFCGNSESKVIDSRVAEDGFAIRRRRQCLNCNKRYTTLEKVSLSVAKRSGVVEPFSKKKIISGVKNALKGRPYDEDDLSRLAQTVEQEMLSKNAAIVDSYDVGLAILRPLKELDKVAYLRFASVYQGFNSLEDFESEIEKLKKED